MTRPVCGECPACLSITLRILRRPCTGTRSSALPPPTVEGLERHAARFGPDQVAETAAEYGLAVNVERPRRVRTKGPTLKQRVAAYVADGVSVDVIAEMEDLSPARARRLVQEVSQ